MTKEKKWFKRLEKLLGEIPDTVEVIVEPVRVAHTGEGQVLMVPRGREFETFEDDVFDTDHASVAIASFRVKAVTGNSESV